MPLPWKRREDRRMMPSDPISCSDRFDLSGPSGLLERRRHPLDEKLESLAFLPASGADSLERAASCLASVGATQRVVALRFGAFGQAGNFAPRRGEISRLMALAAG